MTSYMDVIFCATLVYPAAREGAYGANITGIVAAGDTS